MIKKIFLTTLLELFIQDANISNNFFLLNINTTMSREKQAHIFSNNLSPCSIIQFNRDNVMQSA